MSTFDNVESEFHEGPRPHHPRRADSYVEKEDLEPVEQGGDYSSVPHTYEDIDRYTPITKPGSTIQPQYEEIPLRVTSHRPQGHNVTPGRDASPDPGQAEGLLPLPVNPDRSARTNRNKKWIVVGLAAVGLTVIGVVVWITFTYTTGNTTGNGATGHCTSMPCENNGTCYDNDDGFTCQCVTGYSGDTCQHDTDECESGPCSNGGTCVDRVNGYTCQCRPGFGGANCQSSQLAFSAYRPTKITRSLATSWRRVEYRDTLTDLGGAYRDSIFRSPSTDIYYVAMSARPDDYVSYCLVGAPHSLGLSATSTNLRPRTLGRSCMLEIPSQGEVGMQYTGSLHDSYSTSWSMFSMTAAFHPLVAFTVTRTTPTTEPGKVPYQESLVNTGDGYRPADSHFVAPYNGSYYFTVSAGVAAGQKARLHIVKNDEREIELLGTDTTPNGIEMISSAAIVKLSRGDRVHVELMNGSLYSGLEFRETSFSGFLYSPAHGQAIAWSVWRTDSFIGTGPDLEPVPYDTILVNEGHVYDTSQHVVTVPVSGVYCVHLVGGAPRGQVMNVYLRFGRSISGGSHAASILDSNTGRNGETTVSQSVLLTVEAGDLVWVWAQGVTGRGLYSNPGLVTGFSGFLVYPN